MITKLGPSATSNISRITITELGFVDYENNELSFIVSLL